MLKEVVEDIKVKLSRNERSRNRDRRRHKTIEKEKTNRIWIHIQ